MVYDTDLVVQLVLQGGHLRPPFVGLPSEDSFVPTRLFRYEPKKVQVS